MKKLPLVIERDLRTFFQHKSILFMRWFSVLFQIAVFGVVLSRMVVVMEDYFYYYSMGVIVITLYSTAIFIGYEIYDEAEHGVVEYLLTLPITRKELVLGRSLAGGIRAFVHMAPIVLILTIMMNIHNIWNLFLAFSSIFLFAFGASGLSITLAVGLKSGDRFDIIMGALDAFIVRFSAALYPQAFMPAPIALVSEFNPLSYASDLFRWTLNFNVTYLSNPIVAVGVLLMFLVSFNLVGVFFYERTLEGGNWR